MNRQHDSCYDYGHGSFIPTLRSTETVQGLTQHTKLPTVSPSSYNSQQTRNSEKTELYDPCDPGSSSDSSEVELTRSPPRFTLSNWVTYPNNGESECSGRDKSKSPSEVPRKRSRSPNDDIARDSFTCDMCNLEFPKATSLGLHLKCSGHWEIMEHVQNLSDYDDTTVAFLHEAMLAKVRQGDKPQINKEAVRALQDKEYITVVEMLHCAPCQVSLSMHPSALQDHLSSKDHLRKKMEHRAKQLRDSVNFAKATINQMKAEYASFLEGKDPFQQTTEGLQKQ
ncbi:DBIRD complex subunit ZNF326 isoform X1 [Esox lucius]|uniref:DBIRD complex subunit ZNF326 isoform X1 n=1 Tax=Esox lucius TaxID=8010 RepID=UPI001476D08F|nr:DBIRD complex subunit ZNF326 isoform X1 [Esox lucius]